MGDIAEIDFSNRDASAVLFQYPDTEGTITDFTEVIQNAQTNGVSGIEVMCCRDVVRCVISWVVVSFVFYHIVFWGRDYNYGE